jgi:hypothetical protein
VRRKVVVGRVVVGIVWEAVGNHAEAENVRIDSEYATQKPNPSPMPAEMRIAEENRPLPAREGLTFSIVHMARGMEAAAETPKA